MERFLWVQIPVILLTLWSCAPDEKIMVEREIAFSINNPEEIDGGRTAAIPDAVSVLVTIKDSDGATVTDRKELTLYKFGANFLSQPLILKTNANEYRLTEFLVVGEHNTITYATPKEGSKFAQRVADALDIGFTISNESITMVRPEVLAVTDSAGAEDFGYGQFGFRILPEEVINKVDVYVAGYIGGNAAYWKNGVPVKLTDSGGSSSATSIFVSEDDVYVTGRTLEPPLYWKNGEKKFLPVPSNSVRGETHDVVVNGDDVHIVGDYFTSTRAQPTYWKNGIFSDLQIPSPFSNGHADKITLDGLDVYVSGYVRTWNTVLLTAALWKNGEFIPLQVPSGYFLSDASGVKVSDGHVYVSGYIATSPYSPGSSSMRAVYWKDGEMQVIEPAKRSTAAALDVVGNDVYVPYSVNVNDSLRQVKYWKNGEEVFVDEGAVAFTYDLSLLNGDVYIAGTYKQRSADRAIACYWINERRVLLESEKESQAVSCFVVGGN